MKEKLIEILRNPPDGVEQACDRPTIDAILAVLKCSECLHWDKFTEDVEAGSCDEVDRLTRPDFFCARWEGKE